MSGECASHGHHSSEMFTSCPGEDLGRPRMGKTTRRESPNYELIDGVLYRKKLEKGFINYREVLSEERRCEAVSSFHQRRPGQRHLTLEETYKCVAENYWWEDMYFQIRDIVLSCPRCQSLHKKKAEELEGRCVTKTMAGHGLEVLSKLRNQREAGLFCDITLRTNGRSFAAHKAVLAAVSDHFQEIFSEMDVGGKVDIDLTGFNEDSLLSLLDFSYSSTLSVRQEDLPEVCAMARHLGMWPALEACSALLREQERQLHSRKAFISALRFDSPIGDSFDLRLDMSDAPLHQSPKRSLRRTPKAQGHNGLPQSPVHRMKLMDFKSPSSKKAAIPRHTVASSQPRSYPPVSPSNCRLLRSSPGAAKEVEKLLPPPETPRKRKKSHSASQLSHTSKLSPLSPVRVKQETGDIGEDEEDYARAQEKYKLMSVLGLQRTALLPRPEDLIGWRQKKRLRKLKANNYSLTKRRKPRSTSPALTYSDIPLSLPLCNTVNTRLLHKPGKGKPLLLVERAVPRGQRSIQRHIPPSDRSMRSKGVLPDLFQPPARPPYGGRELRRSVRKTDSTRSHTRQPPRQKSRQTPVKNAVRIKPEPIECSISSPQHTYTPSSPQARGAVKSLRYNSSRPAAKSRPRRPPPKERPREEPRRIGNSKLHDPQVNGLQVPEVAPQPSFCNHPMYKAIKEEPAEPLPVCPGPPSPDLGKRQSKPPIKLLDSGFLFSFCRPVGGLKKEEESVDICLTRSLSQIGDRFDAEESPPRILRTRRKPDLTVVKREAEERRVTLRTTAKTTKTSPEPSRCCSSKTKSTPTVLGSKGCSMLDSVRRARLKQLRGPRSQAPKAPKTAHACLQCPAAYKDCVALIMHRLRHIEGKHWPCPLCSKTFFRLRNVRNHIRTHEPKLYKCRSCIAAGS